MSLAYVKIDASALIYNAKKLQSEVGKFFCVLKSDAYGHGALECARALRLAGFKLFAFYSIEEAASAQMSLPDSKILVFGRTEACFLPFLAEKGMIQTVFSNEYLREATPFSGGLPVHIKLDSGMNRTGFKASPEDIKNAFFGFKGRVEGVYTHFHSADASELSGTLSELSDFKAKAYMLKCLFERPLFTHAAASAASLRIPEARMDASRIGLALYGILPKNCLFSSPLKPVMSFYAPIIAVKAVKKGENVGYGCDRYAERDMMLATASLGYSNGFLRSSENFKPYLKGRRVPIIGRICMDRCMLDVSEIFARGGTVSPYDEIEIFGDNISVTELAAAQNTIPYEVLTSVGRQNRRKYMNF